MIKMGAPHRDRNNRTKRRKLQKKLKKTTEWLQKHCENLNIEFDFKKSNSWLKKNQKNLKKRRSKKRFYYYNWLKKKARFLTSIINKQWTCSKRVIQHAVGVKLTPSLSLNSSPFSLQIESHEILNVVWLHLVVWLEFSGVILNW